MTHRIPLGPFELHRCIGRGGMGEVWEGLHVPQQFPVAVKVLTQRGLRRDVFVEAFRNEVEGLAGLNHPGIVTILDYGDMPPGAAKLSEGLFAAGSPYLVMELAHRGSLKRFVDSIGWFELKAVLFTILDALAHAHAAGVIHRDLKPANILVGCGSQHGRGIKLTDFGLAHAVDQHEFPRNTDSGWGTPQFMAPEQFRGAWRDYGPWTDLYALGIMAFYLCGGRYPFTADDSGSYARAHQLTQPPPLSSRFGIPDGFEGWVERLLQKQPGDRFQCAADAAWALQKLGDPDGATPRRDTVSMVPIAGERSHWITEERLQQPRGTAAWQSIPTDDAPTLVNQPPTTRLMDVHDIVAVDDTLNLGASAPKFEETQDSVPYREAPPLPYTWHRANIGRASVRLAGAGLGLFGLRTIPMVGREEERDALWSALRTVRTTGVAQAVVIRGEAGTGKSRLAQWLTRRAHEVGSAAVLKASFSPIAGPGDGLSRSIARQLRAGGMDVGPTMRRVEHELRRLGVRDENEIAAMTRFILPLHNTSPELIAFSAPTNGPGARYGLLLQHMIRSAEERPVIVWFDDVQWGADALAFVQYVLERQHQMPVPVLFILTLRDEAMEARPVERASLDDVIANRRATAIRLLPLEQSHVAELVRELLHLAPDLAVEVERRSLGNPLFAVQLVGDWVAGGKLRFGLEGFQLREGVAADIPDDLQAVWRERLAQLLKRRLATDGIALEVAAALGLQVELAEWFSACAEFGVPVAPEFTRELLESGLAIQTDYGFEFCHGLFRESLETLTLKAGRRPAIHRACMRMLNELYPHRAFPFSERYAEHAVAAGDSREAITPLLAAARCREDRSEFDIALALLDFRDRVLQENDIEVGSAEWARGWTARASVSLWQGRYADVEALATRAAVEARRHGWSEILSRATLAEGLALLFQAEFDDAERAFERARAEFERQGDLGGCGQCFHGLGRVAHGRGEFDLAEQHFRSAIGLMVRGEDTLGKAQTLNALGDLERDRRNWDRAMSYATEARTIFEELENAIGVADCINDIAELHRLRGELNQAKQGCIDALRRYEALGSEHSMHVRVNLALTLAASGADPEARQLLDEVRVRFEQTDQTAQLALVNLYLTPTLIRLNEAALATRRFQEASALADRYQLRGRDAFDTVVAAIEAAEKGGHAELAQQLRSFQELA